MQVGPRTRRNLRALESFDFECSVADCIQSYVPAASLRIAADDIDKVNRTRYREGRPQGRLSYFQPPASAWPFRSQDAPLSPHSPDNALRFARPARFRYSDQHLTLDRARRRWRTQGVNWDRMLFGWISTAA